MAFFSKAVLDLTFEDVHALVEGEARENVRLEFKSEIPTKDKLLKEISAFANTFGGDLVIGAAEGDGGRLRDLPGVEPAPNYRQTVVQHCMGGLTPPLTPFMSDPLEVPESGGKVVYVIRVPESDQGPHFINGRKGCYVRAEEHNHRFEPKPADQDELRHLFDRRELARQRRKALMARSDSRFEVHAERGYPSSEEGTTGQLDAVIRLWVGPRFPVHPHLEIGSLERVLRDAQITVSQQRYPRLMEPFWQHESILDSYGYRRFSLFEATTWGTLSWAHEIEFSRPTTGEAEPERESYVSLLTREVLRFLKFTSSFFDAAGYDGGLVLDVRVDGILDLPFKRPNESGRRIWMSPEPRSRLDDQVQFPVECDTQMLKDPGDPVFRQVVGSLGSAIGWPRMATDEEWGRLRPAAYGSLGLPMSEGDD